MLRSTDRPRAETVRIHGADAPRAQQRVLLCGARGQQLLRSGATANQRQRDYFVCVPRKHSRCTPAFAQPPQPDLSGGMPRCHPPVRQNSCTPDTALARGDLLQLLPRKYVPHAQHAIAPPAGHTPTAHINHSSDPVSVSLERAQARPVREAPYAKGAVARSGDRHPRRLQTKEHVRAAVEMKPKSTRKRKVSALEYLLQYPKAPKKRKVSAARLFLAASVSPLLHAHQPQPGRAQRIGGHRIRSCLGRALQPRLPQPTLQIISLTELQSQHTHGNASPAPEALH